MAENRVAHTTPNSEALTSAFARPRCGGIRPRDIIQLRKHPSKKAVSRHPDIHTEPDPKLRSHRVGIGAAHRLQMRHGAVQGPTIGMGDAQHVVHHHPRDGRIPSPKCRVRGVVTGFAASK